MKNDLWLMRGDCLDRMKEIESNSVDMILADPPYGKTACKWDSIIPLELMWKELNRIIKPYSIAIFTSQQPFTTSLISSNLERFKYSLVWSKNRPSGVAQAKNKPLSQHEDIIVFSDGVTIHKGQSAKRIDYYPQGLKRINKVCKNHKHDHVKAGGISQRPSHKKEYIQEFTNYPNSILSFKCVNKPVHPTQKPVELMEYLVNSYTQENDVILDFTMGSGSTGVACKNLNRKFIGIELDEEYFKIAQNRINNANKKALDLESRAKHLSNSNNN